MRVHLVLYANGPRFVETKQLLINTIKQQCDHEVVIHDYDLERIKQLPWFVEIQNLPDIKNIPGVPIKWRRDGYFNCWKAFIVRDVYDQMKEDDVLYYVDCSQYHRSGFTHKIDKLCDWAKHHGMIAGSVSNDVKNKSNKVCHRLAIWNIIKPGTTDEVLNKLHVLNSWFVIAKNDISGQFVSDWCKWSTHTPPGFETPIVTQHHTVDQSVFNILVHKYNAHVFYHPEIIHHDNKNRNTVLRIINTESDPGKYFINL